MKMTNFCDSLVSITKLRFPQLVNWGEVLLKKHIHQKLLSRKNLFLMQKYWLINGNPEFEVVRSIINFHTPQ